MAKETELNFDAMSDEDFLAIDPDNLLAETPVEEPEIEPAPVQEEVPEVVESTPEEEVANEAEETPESAEVQETPETETPVETMEPVAEEVPAEAEQEQPQAKEKDAKEVKQEKDKDTPAVLAPEVQAAVDFQAKLLAPFKADGRDFTVRSAEDAIRLMQQGANYSRRMGELKPARELKRMLDDQGLTDINVISHLIDIHKGDKTAITKLLKDKNIDPMDLDISNEVRYEQKSYAGDAKENAFRDEIDNVMATPEGKALVSDIHTSWDTNSKEKLQEQPGLLGNLLGMKQSGVYDKVVNELEYQRNMGYLVGTPFLQAFDQVGEAMRNAGVFGDNKPENTNEPQTGHLQSNAPTVQPVAQGARKVQAQKKTEPNPLLSSNPPVSQNTPSQKGEPDYTKMSDEEFSRLAPPI